MKILRLVQVIALLAALCVASPQNSFAQLPPAIEWQTSFGGTASDIGYALIQTPDHGFVVTGFGSSADGDVIGHHGISQTRDALVLCLDSKGKVLWQRSLGGSGQEGSSCLCNAHGGGYLIGCSTTSTDGDVLGHHGVAGSTDGWIVKLDMAGRTEWTKCYGGSGDEDIIRIIPTNDGGYMFAGRGGSKDGDVSGHHGSTSKSDIWIVKIDSAGVIIWQKSYGGTGTDAPFGLARTDDSAYVIAGYSDSKDGDVTGNHGLMDYWVLKINDTGKVLWENSYGSPQNEDVNTVTVTKDGGYIIGGSAYYSGGDITAAHHGPNTAYDIWIIKLSRDGKLVWQSSLGGTGADYEQDVCATLDGGCLVSGYTTSNDFDVSGHHGALTSYDGWLAKLDSNGKLEWQKSLGGSAMDGVSGIVLTSDGGCAVAANSASSDGDLTRNKGAADYWIIKFAPFAKVSNGVQARLNATNVLSVYPNPASRSTSVHIESNSDLQSAQIEIVDLLGRICCTAKLNASGSAELDLSSLPIGIYAVRRWGMLDCPSSVQFLTVIR
jgi:hypothetical protein